MGSHLLSPPEPSVLEISVFGRGVGESIVIHLSDNRWMVVDSMLEPITKEPLPLRYLRELQVSPENIILVAASHWHDDHIRGIGAVYEAAVNADLVLSSALQTEEFRNLVAAGPSGQKCTSATEEILEILKTRNSRKNSERHSLFHLASDNKRLFFREGPLPTEVWSLSPSSSSIEYALRRIAAYLPREGAEILGRIPSSTPNHAAVVLLIKVKNNVAILGGDLENAEDKSIGWKAIVSSQGRPREKSAYFKIPHHGSANAYEKGVWEEMLEPRPYAVLTPMRSSGLPTDEGLSLIQGHTDRIWIAGPVVSPPKPRRPSVVEKQFKMKVKNRFVLDGPVGHVRYRVDTSDPSAEPEIQCFGPAMRLVGKYGQAG